MRGTSDIHRLQRQKSQRRWTTCVERSAGVFATRHYLGRLGSRVAKALDLQLAGCEFYSRPRRCRITTLGKLFTPTCLSRLQWFSDGMIDCGVRGRGQLCLARQPLRCTALGTGCAPFLQCLGRLSLPPSVGR